MKKLYICLFALSLAACSTHNSPHQQTRTPSSHSIFWQGYEELSPSSQKLSSGTGSSDQEFNDFVLSAGTGSSDQEFNDFVLSAGTGSSDQEFNDFVLSAGTGSSDQEFNEFVMRNQKVFQSLILNSEAVQSQISCPQRSCQLSIEKVVLNSSSDLHRDFYVFLKQKTASYNVGSATNAYIAVLRHQKDSKTFSITKLFSLD